jgi:hypothetical protein
LAGCCVVGTVSPRHFRQNGANCRDIRPNAHKFGHNHFFLLFLFLLDAMPRKMGLSRRHKRGTGQNKQTAHQRQLLPCNNIRGRAGKATELAPAEASTTDMMPILAQSSASKVAGTTTLLVETTSPNTVKSFVIYTKELVFGFGKTLTRSHSKKAAPTSKRTLTTQVEDSTETTTGVAVEARPLLAKGADYETISAPRLNLDAFQTTDTGKERSVFASRKAKSRSTNRIVDAILSSGTIAQQALALRSACLHPKTISLTKTAGLLPNAVREQEKGLLEGVKRTFKEVLGSGKRQRVNVDRSTFAEILSCSFAGTTATTSEIAGLLELNKRSCKRLFRKGEVRYQNAANAEAKWAEKVPIKGFSKVTTEIKEALDQWIRDHPNVRPSPITRDTLLVMNQSTGLKERRGKLLLEISVRELHNDMLLPVNKGGFAGVRDNDGAIIISDSTLRKLLPHELRPATETHKQLCGCELCNTATSLQKTLNAFRLRSLKQMRESVSRAVLPRQRLASLRRSQEYRRLVANADMTLKHIRTSDALTVITCPNVTDTQFPPWKCVLGNCLACPKYQVPKYEDDISNNAPRINFMTYERQSRCSIHGPCGLGKTICEYCQLENASKNGHTHKDDAPDETMMIGVKKAKIVVKKFPTLRCSKIGSFMRHVYLPILEKCRYHFAHKRMLSKMHCYNERHAWYECESHIVKMHRDYAEPISQEKDLEIQSDHFGYVPACSIEGVCVWSPLPNSVEQCNQGLIQKDQIVRTMQFHSHLSDMSKQDASSTHAHLICLLNKLCATGEIKAQGRKTTILDHSDGCSKQYRCGTALYLLSVLSSQFGVTVDRMIGAPGHGKDVVDALNATTKKYIKQKMRMISNPGNDESLDRKMKGYSLSEREAETTSFARECLRLCSVRDRKDGVKSSAKYAKREKAAKISARHYYLQERHNVRLSNLRMTAVGLPKQGPHSGLLARYNLRTDPELGVGRAALRRIPCSCLACREQMSKAWQPRVEPINQERYQQNVDCSLWNVFLGLNDWLIVDLRPTSNTDMDDVQEACYDVIEGLCKQMGEEIELGQIGAIATDDPETLGYYLVQFTSDVFLYYKEEAADDDNQQIEEGSLVVRGAYYSLMRGAPFWYVPPGIDDPSLLFRVQTVLGGDLKLHPVESGVHEPPRNKRKAIETNAAVKLMEEVHDDLVEEIMRRERIDQEETIVVAEEEEDDWTTEGESSDDDEEVEEDTSNN